MPQVARTEQGDLDFTFPSKNSQICSVFSFPNLLVKLTLQDDVLSCFNSKVCMPQTEQIKSTQETKTVFPKPVVMYCVGKESKYMLGSGRK